MASSSLPEAGARLSLDLSDWNASWDSVMGDAEALQSTIDDLSGSVDIEFNIDDAILPFDEIPESTDTEVNVTETDDAKQAVADIHFMALKDKIETIWNIAGNAIDFAKDVGGKLINPFLDVEDVVARINAQTGGGTGIDNLGQFIRDIQAADLGESVDQIGDVVIKAKQLGLPIQEATTAALTFTHTWSDQDPETIVGAWGTALQTGIVDNMQEASDLMTVFFQQGGNIGGDAVQVVQANAQSWADMGLNMSEALSIMDSLQQGTGATASDASNMMQKFDDALTAAAADPASAQAKLLTMMGIDNPKEQGKAIGAETFDGFAEAFSAQSSEQQDLISGMFFGKSGKKFTGAIGEMTSKNEIFQDVVDAAADAATEIDNSLRGAINDFVLEVNTKIAELLSSESIDLPGKIKALKEGFQEAVDVLASGGTVGEALEVGLNIPGLSDTLDTFITNFERIIGNMEIAFLQIVASIQSITGHGAEAETTNKEIARLAGKQLSFDLKIANPDEVENLVAQAVGRGVDPTKIGKLAGNAVSELVGSGDFQKAQALVDALGAVSKTPVDADMGSLMSGAQAVPVTIDVPSLQADIDAAIEAAKPAPSEGWWNTLKPPDNFLETALKTNVGDTTTKGGNWWDQFAPSGETATFATDTKTTLENSAKGITETMDTLKSDVGTAMADTSTSVSTSTDEMNASMEGTALQAQLMDADIAGAMTGNTVTASFDEVSRKADEVFPAVIKWFDNMVIGATRLDNGVSVHLRSIIKQLNDLNFLAMTTIGNLTQVTALGGAGGGAGTTNNTTNNVVVNNNVQGNAAAAANGYALGASLRPGGA
jgi:hypothetical protein